MESQSRKRAESMASYSSKTKGPGEEGTPGNHPQISSQKVADFECRFPCDSHRKNRAQFGLFGRRILGQYPAAPSSPGPFGLLLIVLNSSKQSGPRVGPLKGL